MTVEQRSSKFLNWLDGQVTNEGRGDNLCESDVEPRGRFWMGRLAPEQEVMNSGLGERGDRMEPCAIGIRVLVANSKTWSFSAAIRLVVWQRDVSKTWRKLPALMRRIPIELSSSTFGVRLFGESELRMDLDNLSGQEGRSCVLRTELRVNHLKQIELTILMVNASDIDRSVGHDYNLYECSLSISDLRHEPFILESLPDSFRYDRRVPAYGINCGVVASAVDTLTTTDTVITDQVRPNYWSVDVSEPDLRFSTLEDDPVTELRRLLEAHESWGCTHWHQDTLERRAFDEQWSPEMLHQAVQAAAEFWAERDRLSIGLSLLCTNEPLLRAFKLMNRAMGLSANDRYVAWRPFQIGFLLANLASITNPEESDTVDIVWFATGGGKTETYLGLLITAGLLDRLTGKTTGITAWSRFPLRMLSLQQTQRFADAMAGAELVRRREKIPGDCISVGFLVGQTATPNSISEEAEPGKPDPDDDEMPKRYQVLLTCPFCHRNSIDMGFDRREWRLEHRCTNSDCPWTERALPFYIVDDEISRFLPTVVVGTLDKAASIACQAGMRCFVGAPLGICSELGHGYVYAKRSKRPNGCLVPGCRGKVQPLRMDETRYPPTFRLQDELHLLKDSLGAVDSHYESLLDHLQVNLSGRKPKILASSATLTGYQRQVQVLYQRMARVFPAQGPTNTKGFWTSASDRLARRYIAVAPRGLTIEYAVDRTLSALQNSIRRLLNDPLAVCAECGVDPQYAQELISLYGVNVLYGNSLRDLDAVARSLGTQVRVDGPLNSAALTGRTDFEEVRQTLDRLAKPESDFADRIHIITASSMMSHGVDIDRLNIMVMLGIPLSTAEFIQATARAGRRWPGIVYVMHKMARERDAGVFACFDNFVKQGDRFVEGIPITRRSRRVLEKTVAGMALARILAIHEPVSGGALTTVSHLRAFAAKKGISESGELAAAISSLQLDAALDEPLRQALASWYEKFFNNLENPAGTMRFPSELSPTGGAMMSLRDVEQQAPIFGI